MALKGTKDKIPLIKTSIQIPPDLKIVLEHEAKLLEMSFSAVVGNILAEYYKMPSADYPTWKIK